MNSLSIARYIGVDNHLPDLVPLFLPQAVAASSSHFFDAELLEDESDEPLGELPSMAVLESGRVIQSKEIGILTREIRFNWYHPSPGMFIHNFLRMAKEGRNWDLKSWKNWPPTLPTCWLGSAVPWMNWRVGQDIWRPPSSPWALWQLPTRRLASLRHSGWICLTSWVQTVKFSFVKLRFQLALLQVRSRRSSSKAKDLGT